MLIPMLEIVVILALILLNSFFALSELAIISARKANLQSLANRGDRRAGIALELARDPGIFLSSVQVGITLVGILAGAFGGATLSATLGEWLRDVPYLAPYRQTVSFIIVVTGITYVTLIIGELVPKHLALSNPERWALRVAPTMRLITTLTASVVRFISASTALVMKAFRIPATEERTISDDEITMLVAEGVATGVFERTEKEIIERLFRMSDRRVSAVMTLRADIIWLDIHAGMDEVIALITTRDISAFPVCEGDLDHVAGIILVSDLAKRLLQHEPVVLAEMVRQPLFLHEGTRALKALELLRQSGAYLAIIIDEYGGTEGLLTFTDVFESLVGEVAGDEEPAVIRRDEYSWLVDGMLPTDEVKELLAVEALPNEDVDYQTLAGLVMTILGYIPQTGDQFVWGGFRFEVVDMDGARIDRVLISRLPDSEP